MKKFFYLMAMAIVALTFSACTDDESFLAKVNYPQEATGDKMVVDAWANEFPLEIKTEGAWKVESDSYFFTVEPEEGSGNATVTVSVQNNTRSKRKTGHLTIVFPGHEGENKALTIEQKWKGEYDENADILSISNKIYAVGFGYDTTEGLYANHDCLKAEIFNTSKLINNGTISIIGTQMEGVVNTVTGNSISELSNKLTVKASGSGGFGKFKAEANASFEMDYHDNSNHEYAINYLEATLTKASITKGLGRLKTRTYMTDEAYEDINGLFEDYAQFLPNGKENPDWAKNLIRDYGTHVVISAKLGGRVRQSLDVDITNIKTSYDLNAFAKASYDGIFKAEASAKDDFHKSYQENKNNMKIKVSALGGDMEKAKALVAKDGFTEANYMAWFHSVNGENMSLVGFDDNSLVPLYELVDRANYPDRYQALYDFMTGDGMKTYEDNSTYDSGTVTEFDVPTFRYDYDATLVKDIKLGGQLVGQVCEEYIPAINRDKRVIVVYPVIGTTVRYNMGFFIGDATHKPARVAWNGTDTNISEYPDLDFGQVRKLYLRGASITATPAEGAALKKGALTDEYFYGLHYNHSRRGENANAQFNYPIVKIFNKIWTRMNYNQCTDDNYEDNNGRYYAFTMDGRTVSVWNEYYSRYEARSMNCPQGWRVANLEDYTNMNNKLVANGFSLPGLALQNGGVTGFELYYVGYFENSSWDGSWQDSDEAILGTKDEKYIAYHKNGSVRSGDFRANEHNVRLVKE